MKRRLKIDRVNVDLSKHENLKSSFLKLNPWGTVPFLKVNNTIISESIAICRFLELKYEKPKLFGNSAIEAAKIEMFRRKVEFDGLQAVGEALEIPLALLKKEFLQEAKISAIPELITRGKKRTILFFNLLENTLKK